MSINTLGRRELQCLEFVSRGLQSPEIAHQMNVSIETVKTMRKKIHEKLGAKNMAHAVAIWKDGQNADAR